MKIKSEKQLIEFLTNVAKKGVKEALNDPARSSYLEKMKEEESVYGKLGEVEEPEGEDVEEPAAAAVEEPAAAADAEEEEVDVKGEIDKKIDKTLSQINLEDGVNYEEFLVVTNLFRSTKMRMFKLTLKDLKKLKRKYCFSSF